MPVFWYYCNNCEVKFSWVFTGVNDAQGCPKCHSKDIVRIKNEMYRRLTIGKSRR